MYEILVLLAQAFWLIAPAYAANAFPPLLKGKMPIDCGKSLNGNRILGDGKTIEGTIGGIIFGVLVGSLQILGYNYIPKELGLGAMTLPLALLLSAGAISGDIIGSFLKRRLHIESGRPLFPVDQLDFLLFSLLLASLITSINVWVAVVLVIFTPLIHKIANIIGYFIGVKKNPW